MGDRIHALDGMRAVAACLVVVHHLGVATFGAALSSGGYIALGHIVSGLTASGVELFFVLSPVVLAGPYIRDKRVLDTGKYGARRVERLFPPYLAAWLLAGLQIYLLTAFPTWWTERASLPSFSLSDWISQIGIIYIGNHSYNFAWWSLTIEVAFYVMLPVIVPLVRYANRSKNGVFIALLGSIAVSCVVYALPSAGNVPILSRMAIYASCFWAGLFIAAKGPLEGALSFVAMAAGVAWVLAAGAFDELNPHVGWGLLWFGVVSAAMESRSWISRRLSNFRIVWLGERSYSLYLLHFTVIGLACHAVSLMTDSKGAVFILLTRTISIVASLAIAIVVFHFIERRFARNLVTADMILPWGRHADAAQTCLTAA